MPIPGQSVVRMEISTDNGPSGRVITEVAVLMSPRNEMVAVHTLNETTFPGLEATGIALFGEELWNTLKALDPIPPPEEE